VVWLAGDVSLILPDVRFGTVSLDWVTYECNKHNDCSIRVFGVYIKDAEQEVYHCYAFEAEGSNKEVANAFG